MKRFLPLLILTGLLFGQDVLTLNNGESFEGTFYGKNGEDIIFKVERETSTKKFSINDVDAIITKYDGELTYPFDIPIRQYKNPKNTLDYEGNSVSQSYSSSLSSSIGYSSEKIAFSFYNFSLLLNIDEHSELFGTFTSIIFVSGIGLGYKYYIMGKSKSSLFISVSAQNYFSDDYFSEDFSLWTVAGVSLRKTGGKVSFNIGISNGITWNTPIIPFLNLEGRF